MNILTRILSFLLIFIFANKSYAQNVYSMDYESGSSQYLSISDNASLSITGDISIEAWIKVESFDTVNVNAIASKWGTNQVSYLFGVHPNDGGGNAKKLYFYKTGIVTGGDANTTDGWGSTTISVNRWYHVAVTSTGTTITFYIDGIAETTSYNRQNTSSIADSTSDFKISGYDTSVRGFFDGLLDDIRIWNDVRTSTEISDNYVKELLGNESNLQGYWKLNQNAEDLTPNNNDLTLNGSPVYSIDIPFSRLVARYKAADESVTSSTSLQNDDELFVQVGKNITYVIEGAVFVTSTSSDPEVKIAFTVPSGTTLDLSYTATLSDAGVLLAQGELLESSGSPSTVISVEKNKTTVILIKGTLKVSTTVGSVQLQWAQNNSSPTAVTIKEGSYLRAYEIK